MGWKQVALSMIFLLLSPAAQATLDKPFIALARVGMPWLLASGDFTFSPGVVDTAVLTSAEPSNLKTGMANDSFNGILGLECGYINTESGISLTLLAEVQNFDLAGASDAPNVNFKSNVFNIFFNLEYHGLMSDNHDPRSPVDVTISVGAGGQFFYSVGGDFVFNGVYVDKSTPPLTGTFVESTELAGFAQWSTAIRGSIGFEKSLGSSGFVGMSFALLWSLGFDDLMGGSTYNNTQYTQVTGVTPKLSAFQKNTGYVIMPHSLIGALDIKFGVNFGNS